MKLSSIFVAIDGEIKPARDGHLVNDECFESLQIIGIQNDVLQQPARQTDTGKHRMSGCEGNTHSRPRGLRAAFERGTVFKVAAFPGVQCAGRLVWLALSNRNAWEAPTLASGLLHVSGTRGA
jgi:hypothetical protein